jgi:sortase A
MKRLSTILLILVFLTGLGMLLYPAASDYWNSMVQSRAIVDYESALEGMTQNDYSAYFADADAYNRALRDVEFPLMYHDRLSESGVKPYAQLLDIKGNGIMGYVTIDSIGVELPIYHGTGEAALNVAAGHLEGTSLPVGGVSTHCVLSAHRGLPRARLFTDLDRLDVGDRFRITVMDRVLTYEVDQVLIVLPNDVSALGVDEGRDLCTLVTCTPYGINTHRLLVRGHRVETAEAEPALYVPADAYMLDPLIAAPIVAAPMLLVLLVFVMVRYRTKG